MKPGVQANQVRETSPPNHASNPQQTNLKREFHISQATRDRANACKAYIEKKYSKLKQEEQEKKDAWDQLQKKMENMNMSSTEQELIKRDIIHKETERYRKKRKRITVKDFEPIAIIGRGAFGEVRVCRIKETGEIVAMKKMNKADMICKNQIAHVRAERDVLATSGNPWIVELKFSFQDDKYLYLVMEYLAGGDLMTLLMKKDILREDEAKFYIAEAILAVESVHKMNYIHRDLKPDNILLDRQGHLKLSDFGLCKHVEIRPRFEFKKTGETTPALNDLSNLTKRPQNYRRNRQLVYSTVGTPDYIAPEVFGQGGYTETVDWWSIGVILYEMLVGYPPFFSEDPSVTCQKILHWRKTFVIPPEANLSPAAADLLKRLITDANERLGVNGVEEIKFHPFFAGVDWKRIRDKKPPNVPELKSDIDTSNFDKFEEEEPWYVEDPSKKRSRKDANFVGYTFKRDDEAQRSHLVTALQDLEANRFSYIRPQQKTQQITNPLTVRGDQENMVSSPNPLGKLNSTTSQSQGVLTTNSSVNIANAISSIAQMKSTGFPTNNQISHREPMAKTNYGQYYEPSITSYQGGFGVKSKSPTNATAREKPVVQQSTRETNIKGTTPKNYNFKVESANPTDIRKKELNVNPYSYITETSAVSKPKYTPTNNPVKQYTRPGYGNAENYSSVNTKSSIKFVANPQSSSRPLYNKYG